MFDVLQTRRAVMVVQSRSPEMIIDFGRELDSFRTANPVKATPSRGSRVGLS